jgi:hypothetical protein
MDTPQDDAQDLGVEHADEGFVVRPGGSQPAGGSVREADGFDDHHDASLDAEALQQLLLTTETVQISWTSWCAAPP